MIYSEVDDGRCVSSGRKSNPSLRASQGKRGPTHHSGLRFFFQRHRRHSDSRTLALDKAAVKASNTTNQSQRYVVKPPAKTKDKWLVSWFILETISHEWAMGPFVQEGTWQAPKTGDGTSRFSKASKGARAAPTCKWEIKMVWATRWGIFSFMCKGLRTITPLALFFSKANWPQHLLPVWLCPWLYWWSSPGTGGDGWCALGMIGFFVKYHHPKYLPVVSWKTPTGRDLKYIWPLSATLSCPARRVNQATASAAERVRPVSRTTSPNIQKATRLASPACAPLDMNTRFKTLKSIDNGVTNEKRQLRFWPQTISPFSSLHPSATVHPPGCPSRQTSTALSSCNFGLEGSLSWTGGCK